MALTLRSSSRNAGRIEIAGFKSRTVLPACLPLQYRAAVDRLEALSYFAELRHFSVERVAAMLLSQASASLQCVSSHGSTQIHGFFLHFDRLFDLDCILGAWSGYLWHTFF